MNTENGKFRFKKHENGKITTRNKEELLYTKAFIFDNYLVFKNKKKQGEGGGSTNLLLLHLWYFVQILSVPV